MLYFGVLAVVVSAMQLLVNFAFGDRGVINFELIGHFTGSAGAGALVSALLLGSVTDATGAWLRTTLFGAVSGFTFALMVELQHGPPIGAWDCILSTVIAAVLFPLVRWLVIKGSQP